jgi:hypothetical protein
MIECGGLAAWCIKVKGRDRVPTIDYLLPTADYRLPTADCEVDWELRDEISVARREIPKRKSSGRPVQQQLDFW